jgi:hypothetical protein
MRDSLYHNIQIPSSNFTATFVMNVFDSDLKTEFRFMIGCIHDRDSPTPTAYLARLTVRGLEEPAARRLAVYVAEEAWPPANGFTDHQAWTYDRLELDQFVFGRG